MLELASRLREGRSGFKYGVAVERHRVEVVEMRVRACC